MSTRRSSLTGALLTGAGLILLVWQVRLVGLAEVGEGFRAVGWWGFAGILALSLFRFAARSLAWVVLIGPTWSTGVSPGLKPRRSEEPHDTPRRSEELHDEPRWVPLRSAVAATISGDALGNLSFLSLLVSEPAKAIYVTRHAPTADAFAALTAENFFYSVSVACVILGGTITLLGTFVLPEALRGAVWLSLGVMAVVLGGAYWVARHRPALVAIARRWLVSSPGGRLDRWLTKAQQLETQTYSALSSSPGRLGLVLACEAVFHIASIAEAWLTLWLLAGSASLIHAFLLDTVNRFINVIFRAVPMRMGVDESTTSSFADLLGLGTAVGLTMALIRKARMLVWAVVGLALLGRRALSR